MREMCRTTAASFRTTISCGEWLNDQCRSKVMIVNYRQSAGWCRSLPTCRQPIEVWTNDHGKTSLSRLCSACGWHNSSPFELCGPCLARPTLAASSSQPKTRAKISAEYLTASDAVEARRYRAGERQSRG
jgi:hypothetical protein